MCFQRPFRSDLFSIPTIEFTNSTPITQGTVDMIINNFDCSFLVINYNSVAYFRSRTLGPVILVSRQYDCSSKSEGVWILVTWKPVPPRSTNISGFLFITFFSHLRINIIQSVTKQGDSSIHFSLCFLHLLPRLAIMVQETVFPPSNELLVIFQPETAQTLIGPWASWPLLLFRTS